MTTLGLEYLKHQESKRHNTASEAETYRSNRAQERLTSRSLDETHRSNVAKEKETNRANVAKEKETNRANLAYEGIQRDQLTETIRHNRNTDRANMAKAFGNASNPILAATGASLVDAYDLAKVVGDKIDSISLSDVDKALHTAGGTVTAVAKDVGGTVGEWWKQGPGKMLSDIARGIEKVGNELNSSDRQFYLYH